MKFEPFVALRYLKSPRSDKSISLITVISIIGVALGVSVLIVVLSVMNGFERDLRSALMGVNAHISVGKYGVSDTAPLTENDGLRTLITDNIPAKAVVTYTLNQALINAGKYPKGLLIRGINPAEEEAYPVVSRYFSMRLDDQDEENSAADVTAILSGLKPTETDIKVSIAQPDSNSALVKNERVTIPGIIVGRGLAKDIGVDYGDTIQLIALNERISPIGGLPKMRRFQVRGIFKSGLAGYDEVMAFIDLEQAQKFFLKPGEISGYSVFIEDPSIADRLTASIADKLSFPYYVRSWIDDNANLFAVISLEKLGLSLILTMVILIASFNIIASLIILVIEKKKDIAILKTIGATNRAIRKIFILQGIVIGFSGTLIGEIIGIVICLIIKNYEVVKIPDGVYVSNKIPLYIDPGHLVLIGLTSMLICFLVTVYPSTKAARFSPAESLRND